MTGLYDLPALKYKEAGEQRHYQITDADETQMVGNVVQVVGAEPKGRLKRWLASGPDRSRVVLRVDQPDGTPLAFVDRAEGSESFAISPPVAVVAPDGRLIGRVEHNTQQFAQSYIEGTQGIGGNKAFTQAHRIVDADGAVLCDVTWEETRMVVQLERATGGRFCVYTDAQGTDLGRFEDETLRLNFQLPDPLRMLMLMSPIAFYLMTDL